MENPCGYTIWRMVAVIAYALEVRFSREAALNHKAKIREAFNDAKKKRPFPLDLPRVENYTDGADALNAAIRAYAYGDVAPEPREICVAVAHSVGSVSK